MTDTLTITGEVGQVIPPEHHHLFGSEFEFADPDEYVVVIHPDTDGWIAVYLSLPDERDHSQHGYFGYRPRKINKLLPYKHVEDPYFVRDGEQYAAGDQITIECRVIDEDEYVNTAIVEPVRGGESR